MALVLPHALMLFWKKKKKKPCLCKQQALASSRDNVSDNSFLQLCSLPFAADWPPGFFLMYNSTKSLQRQVG
jgi:hypothetical protein